MLRLRQCFDSFHPMEKATFLYISYTSENVTNLSIREGHSAYLLFQGPIHPAIPGYNNRIDHVTGQIHTVLPALALAKWVVIPPDLLQRTTRQNHHLQRTRLSQPCVPHASQPSDNSHHLHSYTDGQPIAR